jgi:hypothetical protein
MKIQMVYMGCPVEQFELHPQNPNMFLLTVCGGQQLFVLADDPNWTFETTVDLVHHGRVTA